MALVDTGFLVGELARACCALVVPLLLARQEAAAAWSITLDGEVPREMVLLLFAISLLPFMTCLITNGCKDLLLSAKSHSAISVLRVPDCYVVKHCNSLARTVQILSSVE